MNALFIILLFAAPLFAEGPNFQHKDTFVQQEFDNVYQDIKESRADAGRFITIVSSAPTTDTSTTGTAYVNSVLGVTITPKKTNSYILIEANFSADNNTNNGQCNFTISRGATDLSANGNGFAVIRNITARYWSPTSIRYMDTSIASGATTYFVQFKSNGTGSCSFGEGEQKLMTAFEIQQ